MAQFVLSSITNAGMALIQAAQISGAVTFTKISAGKGSYTEEDDLTVLTALRDPVQNTPISRVEIDASGQTRITAVLANTSLASGYHVTELGLYATHPDTGVETLVAVSAITDEATADYLPAYDGSVTVSISLELYVLLAPATAVTIISQTAYASADDFNTLADDFNTLADAAFLKANIVQNAVTASATKVPSAAVAKGLQDQINTLNSNINVYDSITLEPGANCEEVTSVTAFKHGNLLFLRFAAKPSANIAAGDNLDITLKGVTLQLAIDWRLMLGVAGTNIYTCWISNSSSPYIIRCRCMNTQWVTTAKITFSGILLCA